MSDAPWMIYGASGYSGERIALEATRRGLRPILASRTPERARQAADRIALATGAPRLETRAFTLDRPFDVQAAVRGMRLVLSAAGPFSATAAPLLDACLAVGAHYLDITGEIDAILEAAARDQAAQAAGTLLLPAVGFDVAPTDALARIVAEQVRQPTSLIIAFTLTGGVSPGTMNTALQGLTHGGRVRREGAIVSVTMDSVGRDVPFSHRTLRAVRVPWGDVATAYYTTRIPNIETYWAPSREELRAMKAARWLRPVLTLPPVLRFTQKLIRRHVRGPDDAALARSRAWLWSEASNERGERRSAALETPGGYAFTFLSAVSAVEQVLAGKCRAGFHTPMTALGVEFVLNLPGVRLIDPWPA